MRLPVRIALCLSLVLSVIPLAGRSPASAGPRQGEPGLDPSLLRMTSRRLVDSLERPVDIANAGDGSGRIFVVEKAGRIRIIADGKLLPRPFLDITDRVNASGNEQGLLGLSFHPQFKDNGFFFVNYSTSQTRGGLKSGDTVVSRFTIGSRTDQGDPASEKSILSISQPYANHNGGNLAFGPDGYLWIGTGDGGSGGDPQGNGQKLNTLLAKFLRIDVDRTANGLPYAIPPDNPFVGRTDARPEIWSYGWRNPWRYAFDQRTGDLWVGDVGQNAWEEVDVELRGSPGGLNYGWNTMEGTHCFRPAQNCDTAGLVLPVAEYNHSTGVSITGGEVYRGKAFPALDGLYFYADYGSKRLWAIGRAPAGAGVAGGWRNAQVATLIGNPTTFGLDEDGEIYVAFDNGAIHALDVAGITPSPPASPSSPPPTGSATAAPTATSTLAPSPAASATRRPTPEILDTPSPAPTRWTLRLPWLSRP